jgi:hypothetical protein
VQLSYYLAPENILEEVEEMNGRERKYLPMATLSMISGQVLNADGSCQNAVNAALVNRLVWERPAGSADTGAYCRARQRLPEEMVQALARQTAALVNAQTPEAWLWRGRHVKLVDGTTTVMPDSEHNQARYPQHGNQARGGGFPMAGLVGVLSLANGKGARYCHGSVQRQRDGRTRVVSGVEGVFCRGRHDAGRQLLLQLLFDRGHHGTRGGCAI